MPKIESRYRIDGEPWSDWKEIEQLNFDANSSEWLRPSFTVVLASDYIIRREWDDGTQVEWRVA